MRASAASVVLLVSLLAAPASAQFHMEDTLRGGTSGNAIGGAFSADGWTVTGQNDRIWWALPRLGSGSIELSVTNVSLANLIAADGEIFALYEAGHAIEEPIPYSPELRNNHYKAFIRVYGTNEEGRAGSMKLIWIMCPSGAPGYSTDTALCGCDSFLEEPFEDPGPWDAAATYRLRLEWGGGVSRILRDGVEVVRVDWSESGIAFGPHELHMMLGNSRNGAVGDGASMPIGAVFSDLVVDGIEGPVATCGGTTEPDAGVPAADAGIPLCDRPERLHAAGLDPAAGRGDAQVFTATYTHCDGASSFRVVQLTVADAVDALAQVAVAYEDGQLYLGTDTCAPGEARTLENAYGSLDCARTTVTDAVDDRTVEWALAFDPATFAGTHGVWLDGKGPATTTPEPRIGWTRRGEYTVEATVPIDAGARADGATPTFDAGEAVTDAGDRPGGLDSGCGCRVTRPVRAPAMSALVVGLALLVMRRRRA